MNLLEQMSGFWSGWYNSQDFIAIMEDLLESGQSFDDIRELLSTRSDGGLNPLHLASQRTYDEKIITYMICYGADVNSRCAGRKATCLIYTVQRLGCHVKLVQAMVETILKFDGVDVYLADKYHRTALHYACSKCYHYEVVKMLCAAGADVNLVDQNGNTALLEACKCPHVDIRAIRLLLDLGADVSQRNARGETCLHLTSTGKDYRNCLDGVQELLFERGADPLARDQGGNTPLLRCISSACSERFSFLLKCCHYSRDEIETMKSLSIQSYFMPGYLSLLDYTGEKVHHLGFNTLFWTSLQINICYNVPFINLRFATKPFRRAAVSIVMIRLIVIENRSFNSSLLSSHLCIGGTPQFKALRPIMDSSEDTYRDVVFSQPTYEPPTLGIWSRIKSLFT